MTDCARCEKRSQLGYVVCLRCVEQLRRKLRDVETYLTILPMFMQPVRKELGRQAPGFGSCSPANDDVIVALDSRSNGAVHGPDDIETPIRSIVVSIAELADWVRDKQGVRSVGANLPYLLSAVDWCARQSVHVALPFAQRVSSLHAQYRRLAQDAPPSSMGTCIQIGCKGDVYPQRDGAVCRECDFSYDGLDLVRFRVAQ